MPNLNNATFAKAVLQDALYKTATTLKYVDTTAKAAVMIETGNTKTAAINDNAATLVGIALCMKKSASGEVDVNAVNPELLAVARDIAQLA